MNPRMAKSVVSVTATSGQPSDVRTIIKQESVMDIPYSQNSRSSGSTVHKKDEALSAYEAAQILLQIGATGRTMNRRSVITENNNRSGTNSSNNSYNSNNGREINPVDLNAGGDIIVTNPTTGLPLRVLSHESIRQRINLQKSNQRSAFASVLTSTNNSDFPSPRPIPSGSVPYDGRNYQAVVPSSSVSVTQSGADFVRNFSHPISVLTSTSARVPISVVHQVKRQESSMEIGRDVQSPSKSTPIGVPLGGSSTATYPFELTPAGTVRRVELEFEKCVPSLPFDHKPKIRGGSGSSDPFKTSSVRSSSSKHVSNVNVPQYSLNYDGIKDTSDFKSFANRPSQITNNVERVEHSMQQQKSPTFGNGGVTPLGFPNSTDIGSIRIVNPSQLGSNSGNINRLVISQGSAIIFTPKTSPSNSGTNGGENSNDYGNNASFDNGESPSVRKKKLLKKAIRAKVPMSLDATKPITVDKFDVKREFWAKAFVQSDICHAAGILFKALFTPEEIQSCTLRGRNGTFLLDLDKRSAIFRAVGWMKNKNQDPYSFDSSNISSDYLSQEEKMIIEKKVFVERRYQTSRKIREDPLSKKQKIATNNNNTEDINDNRIQMLSSQFPIEQRNSLLERLIGQESNRSHQQQQQIEQVVVKAEPADILGHDDIESDGRITFIKREREDEPMELDEEVEDLHREEPTTSSNSELKPPSPKQMKMAAY